MVRFPEALRTLKTELSPASDTVLSTAKYRQDLAVNFLYKALLSIYQSEDAKLRSGADGLVRPISSGIQTYQEKKSEFPLKQPLPNMASTLQASGEAMYVSDMPSFQHELCAAFVISDVACATIGSIDPAEALAMPGVIRFFGAADIPQAGVNNFLPSFTIPFPPQELFASQEIEFCGQMVGIIVAENQALADEAAQKVKITYSEVREAVVTLEQAIERRSFFTSAPAESIFGDPDGAFKEASLVISGEMRSGSQYHFYIESQVSLCVPSEDGLDLYVSSQYPELNQGAVAAVLGKDMTFVNVTTPRLGGAFGGKLWDSCSVSAAVSLAAYLLDRPVRMLVSLPTNMQIAGKRPNHLVKYKAACSGEGKILAVDIDVYIDVGHKDVSGSHIGNFIRCLDMGYYIPNWKIRPIAVKTNVATAGAVRSPGSVPSGVCVETIMEHVAKELKMHPILFKEINLYESGQVDMQGHTLDNCTMRELWRRLKDTAEVDARMRQVEHFNQNNLWKKKGITMGAVKYALCNFGLGHSALVTVFGRDGTVVVSQGGVEMGQGLYTKVAQAVAHTLGIPLSYVRVRPNQNVISPDNCSTGGSVGSERSVVAAIEACNILRERMEPMRAKFPDADWKELCEKCVKGKVDMSAKYTHLPSMGSPFANYFTYCAAVVETEVDVLTGEYQINRADIMMDLGESLNPMIDVGQVEGAFLMGLGCYLTEDTIWDMKTGKLLNNSTWEYKPPTSKDIPVDWRVHLLPDAPNPAGVRGSKAVGEPPISLAACAVFANKSAIESTRKDLFGATNFVPPVIPLTVERNQQISGVTVDQLRV